MKANTTNPASSGPAGSHFEGQVGAHYLLSMLTGTEPRGLPGTTIDRIEFQRAAEGRPLDDVIVHAHDLRGAPAVLEIQVKRSITFASTDRVFRAVVGQIVEASRRPDFWTTRYELAIATARTSRKIDGAYQDVLTWARQLGDSATFRAGIDRPGFANDDMRTFVHTFKSHLRDAESSDDDETVWRLLRKLQILVFDFTAQGSASEALAKERAVRALHPDDTQRAGNLWTSLVDLALKVAASGGDRIRDRLIEDLRGQSFRFVGDRRYLSARVILAEASRNALADISDHVGDVILTRHERVAAVHAALDDGRYVEIRGDAGVGKSGVLKHFAGQVATESQVIVLSPGRSTPRGWAAMRAVLGFDGTARELLTDLAADGGAVLFVDNLDFFEDEERRTVVDLVREAAGIPGFAVIVTARRNFGVEEPSWLPPDVLDRLGRAEPIMIDELSAAEVDEIRHAAPRLAPLLADTHPARDVTRNLFRLARLVTRPEYAIVLRTEADMAEQWWQTADGKLDGDHRDRARLLKALAEVALSHAGPLDVSNHPAQPVNALVASETLRDLRNDRVAFRHDVLREWAIGNLLHSDPTMIERLPLTRPASAALARGVELAARLALERAVDSTRWQSLVERLSCEGTHGSWRRAALLALVRSEISLELLTRASGLLLANRASMLRELIRLVMAVDVEPASKFFEALGVDPAIIPPSVNVPSGPSWYRLIAWLLSLGQSVPVATIPDVVDYYTAWSIGMGGHDPLTPLIVPWLYRWLTEIEAARHVEHFRDLREPFNGELDRERTASLESDLRTVFLAFCHRTPELAGEYLRSLSQRHHRPENVIRSILKFRGSLAQSAPAELAELTVAALIAEQHRDEKDDHHGMRGPFTHHDLDFVSAPPAQGPFFELLTHAPQNGLSLVRQLVDRAIAYYSKGRKYGTDSIIIAFPEGERVFPWMRSYAWSREGAGRNCVTSALMALEAWAHRRIETGESVETVLADVLGPPGSPAAFLLVAVDLLLSHWPKSREAAVPFVACPELLSLDRERQLRDNVEYPDLFGLRALEKEPVGVVSLDSLKKRPSRRASLEALLNKYAVGRPEELREALNTLLRRAAERLGPPDNQSNFRDPAFMLVHAINRVDPSNWREVSLPLSDGTQRAAHEYVPPETERQHLAALQDASEGRWEDANMQAGVMLALEDPSRSSAQFAAAAVEWAQRVTAAPKNADAEEDKDEDWMQEHAVVSTATIVMRDGDAELRAKHQAWAHGLFAQALRTKEDPVHRFRSGLRFNPVAIAFVGMIHALKDRAATEDVRSLLQVVTREEPAAAHGFGVAFTTLAAIDERLLRAVLRCAFAACIRPHRKWGVPEEEVAARVDPQRKRVQKAVEAELAWLGDHRSEPDWPAFPIEAPRLRRHIRLRGGRVERDEPVKRRSRSEEYADHQAAAVWLVQCRSLVDMGKRPWLREMARAYAGWTAEANGAGLDPTEDVENPPREWNDAYFELLARCLPGLLLPEIEQLALDPIGSLPDTSFYDILPSFLRSGDIAYFNDRALEESVAVGVHSKVAGRLMASAGWKRLRGQRGGSIETHIGPAIAVVFFNDYGIGQPPRCYLPPVCIDRLPPFIPVLEKLVESGPSLFLALVTLNLLEVSLRSTHLPFMVTAAKAWIRSYPQDTEFWVDYGIGRRFCLWLGQIHQAEPARLKNDVAVGSDVDQLLAALVGLGVPEAKRLEEALARVSENRA
ncbi:MAG: ATP-binding protein [Nitrospirota bacterium]|nr:ATP-binding protein [Nitrospirota bacterium]